MLPEGRLLGLAVSLFALIAVLAPATAEANFTGLAYLTDIGQNAEEPQVAIDGNGNGLAVWDRSDGTNIRIQARSRSAAGVLGSTQTLSDAGQDAFSPQVAVNSAGAGIIVWTRSDGFNDRIQAVTRSSSGVLGPVLTLSDALQNAEEPQVAIDSNGDAVAVWDRSDGTNTRIQAVQVSSLGVPGAVQTLSASGQNAFSSQVAIDGNGNALIVWTRFNGLCQCDKIQARTLSAAGVLGSVQDLSAGGQNAEQSQVGVDANGNGVAVWERFDGTNDRIQARTRSAAGVLGSVLTLSAAGQDAFSSQVAVNGAGAGLIDWTRFNGFCQCDKTQAVPLSSAGVLGSVQDLTSGGQNAEEPQVGIDANGNGVAIWASFGSNNNIQARTRSAAGVLGSKQTLSTSGTGFSPQVAVNGPGAALADWTRFGGAFDRIQAAAGP